MHIALWTALAGLTAHAAAVPTQNVGALKIIEHPNPAKRQLLQNIVGSVATTLNQANDSR
jgi:hypothetical protein